MMQEARNNNINKWKPLKTTNTAKISNLAHHQHPSNHLRKKQVKFSKKDIAGKKKTRKKKKKQKQKLEPRNLKFRLPYPQNHKEAANLMMMSHLSSEAGREAPQVELQRHIAGPSSPLSNYCFKASSLSINRMPRHSDWRVQIGYLCPRSRTAAEEGSWEEGRRRKSKAKLWCWSGPWAWSHIAQKTATTAQFSDSLAACHLRARLLLNTCLHLKLAKYSRGNKG